MVHVPLRPAPIPRPRSLGYSDFLKKKLCSNQPVRRAGHRASLGSADADTWFTPGSLFTSAIYQLPGDLTFPGLSLSWPTGHPSDMLSAVSDGVMPCSQVLLEVKLIKSRVVNSRPSQHTPAAPLQASDVSRSEAKPSVPAATLPSGQPCPRQSAGRDRPASCSTGPSPAGFWGSWGQWSHARNWDLGPAPPGNQAHLSGVGLGGRRTRMQMLSRSLWLERLLCASVTQVCCPHGSRFGSPYRFLTNENLFAHKITSGRVRRGLNHILGKRSESSSVEMRR